MDAREDHSAWTAEDSIEELGQLARTAGAEVVGALIQKMDRPHPVTYLGKGKLQEVADLRHETDYTLVIADDELSPTQQRTLEKALKVKLLDRTALILDIFAGRAQTHEGRLQVELAQHEYLLPRLAGQWSHLERLGGGIGTRGPGETQLETDRRLIRRRIGHLKRELQAVRRHRNLYRQRRVREGVPVVALVGYTNAGKSTLLNALTDAGVLAEDRLFATLDPTTRRIRLPSRREILLSDTVGFIQKLPPTVVEAFRATLEELESADLLLHVVDITHPNAAEQTETVQRILGELKLDQKPVVTAFNKADRLVEAPIASPAGEAELGEVARDLAQNYPDAVLISAARGWHLDRLLACIEDKLREEMVPIAVRLPHEKDGLVSLFRERGSVSAQEFREDGVYVTGRLPEPLLALFAPYRLPGVKSPAPAGSGSG